jgi:hypothetical protein
MEPSPDDCNDDNDDDDCDDNGDDDCDDNGNDVKWTITLSILAFYTTYDARGDVDDKCSFALLYAISQYAPIVIVSWLLLRPL